MRYIFDGTFRGLLTCVFEAFERREFHVDEVSTQVNQSQLFADSRTIVSDETKAHRVLKGLARDLGKAKANDFYQVFLSEDEKAVTVAFQLMIRIFNGNSSLLENFADDCVLYFHQALDKVHRERHRMKAFVRFQRSTDGLYTALVDPDFNVLPLIADFFRKRYADQLWMIYDLKRKYGLLYNLETVSEVVLSEDDPAQTKDLQVSISQHQSEDLYQRLWRQYFKSTNIEARRNMKLHLRYVPKRYWKYLVEKKPLY